MNWIEYEIPHMPPLEQQVIRLALIGQTCAQMGFLLHVSEKDIRATISVLRKRLVLPNLIPSQVNNGRFAALHGKKPLRNLHNPEWAPLPPLNPMDDPAF